jgi:nitrogen fixation/metabolism regulation signal transduction histidine kinase
MNPFGQRRTPIRYEDRITMFILAGGLPSMVVSLILTWHLDISGHAKWTIALALGLCWLGFGLAARERVVRPMQTISNLLAARREGDFSIRGRSDQPNDALSQIVFEVNELVTVLRTQRLGAVEATALLHRVMEVIDVAIFTFDGEEKLGFVNRAGQELLQSDEESLLGKPAEEIGLAEPLHIVGSQTTEMQFPSRSGRWGIRNTPFYEEGHQHRLIAIQDLTRALREEEIDAWKRLVRVIGHELNNSLTPIKSIAGSVQYLIQKNPPPEDWREDAVRGLGIISGRADALGRFMSSYAKLAKLPPPEFRQFEVMPWIRRVVALETRLPVELVDGPPVSLHADSDQLEQVMINLIRNAVDASAETGGGVRVGWRVWSAEVEIFIEDDGPGVANPSNLFVPFFTTKPGGSGIGLVLCRQIAENHSGTVTLSNRPEAKGCVAILRIPLQPAGPGEDDRSGESTPDKDEKAPSAAASLN